MTRWKTHRTHRSAQAIATDYQVCDGHGAVATLWIALMRLLITWNASRRTVFSKWACWRLHALRRNHP